MNRFKVYLVELNVNVEFSDGSFTGWNERPSAAYGFNNLKDAQKHIWERKQEENKRYRNWVHQNGNKKDVSYITFTQ